jgi:hypothetical protein
MKSYTPLQRIEEFDSLIQLGIKARADFIKSYADRGENAYTSPFVITVAEEEEEEPVAPDLICGTNYSNGGTTCLVGYCTADTNYNAECLVGTRYCTMGFSG